MPYGLSNAPSVFQEFMNEVFREFLHRSVIVYIDDILIYSRNLADHRHHVAQVLQKLRQFHLYLKLEKCEFHRPTVQFLGYVIGEEGIQMDQGKVTVMEWPSPQSVKELQRFLGFANFYRRFIKGFSLLTAPLTTLLHGKPKSLSWSSSAHEAVESLRTAFSMAPILRHPDPHVPFVVEVDASTTGVGAVLSQQYGEPPRLQPCAYYSKKLTPAEQNYDIKNLQYLREQRGSTPDKPAGPCSLPGLTSPLPTVLEAVTARRTLFPAYICRILPRTPSQFSGSTLNKPAPLGCPEGKTFIPSSQRQSLLGSVHNIPGSGHPGSQRTLSLLQAQNWWPSMSRDVIRYVRSCSVCAMSSTPRHLPVGKLVSLPIPRRPWSHMGIDFVTDLPNSEGNTCILVAVDRFSKACKLIPLRGLPTALETAEHLFHHLFRNFGVPEDIVSDRGPQFISHVWKAFFHLPGVTVSLSSGYHPQTNGQAERKIQELGRYLRAYCQEDQYSWSRFFPWAEYAQNSLRQNTTGLTPFQCILGYKPPLFPWTGEPSEVPAVDQWFWASERVWDSAHIHLQRAVRRHKDFADARHAPTPFYHPGDRVWLSTRDLRLRLPCKKLSPRYIGPFPIQRQINEVTYQLQLPPRYRVHPTFHVSLLKPCSSLTPDQHEPDEHPLISTPISTTLSLTLIVRSTVH